jgi:glycolate oxidase FAD binding subunit
VTVLDSAVALCATGVRADLRDGDPEGDAIDGVVPALIVEPHTAEGVAATLAWAADNRLSVVIRGAGTKIQWGAAPHRIDVILGMRRLNRILSHRPGDLTVSVEAGVSLQELNQALFAHGQRLPLDPPFEDRATIGGMLATNDSGPERHRFGTPRDLVIGIQLATTDGRLAKAGGQVVKNVAGYDLSKLISGSFGSLAAIVGATFKLSPLPPASATILIERLGPPLLARIADAVHRSQLEPVAFDIYASRAGEAAGMSASCLLRFASFASAVDAQVADASARVAEIHPSFSVVTGEAEQEIWRQHAIRLWGLPGAIVRANWLPADLPAVLDLLGRLPPGAVDMIGRAGVGAGLIRIDGDTHRQAAAIEALRGSNITGHVVVARGTTGLKAQVDVWGARRNARLLDSIKRALDPNGVLGAGRGPV